MGNFLKLRLETMDSSDKDKIKDSTVTDSDEKKDTEERSVADCASEKILAKPRQSSVDSQSSVNKVPKKRRTPRVFLGQLTCKPGEDAYLFSSAQVIRDEKISRVSEKLPLDVQEYNVPDRVFIEKLTSEPGEDSIQCRSDQVIIHKNSSKESENRPLDEDGNVPDEVLIEKLTCEPREDSHQYHSAQMIINKENSRKSKKHPLDEDYIVFDDDYGVESSEKKRQKNGVEKTVTVGRKPRPQVQIYPSSELPQNFQDYISELNLEAPLLFVAQKALYSSDIRRNQNRLLLPEKIINPEFFNKYVTDKINHVTDKINQDCVNVSLVDNKMHEYHTLTFAKWNMNSSSNYLLKTAWFDVVKDNKLEEAVFQKDNKKLVVMKEDDRLKSDVVVQVWCSLKQGRLWFVLNMQARTECKIVGRTKEGLDIITKLLSD